MGERATDTRDNERSEADPKEDAERADPSADEPDADTKQTSHYVPI